MGTKSAEEALIDDQMLLGKEYGLAFHHACQELWNISYAWDRYQALFGTEARVELLNRSGSNFWGVLQGQLFEDVLLRLCRITDPAENRHQKNLSTELLLKLEPSRHKARLSQAVKRAFKATAFARKWRDKRIAHNALEHKTDHGKTLPLATANRVTHAIIYIHDVLRWISARHQNAQMYLVDMGDNDVIEMMCVIADGLKLREIRQLEYSAGRFSDLFRDDHSWAANFDPTKRYESRQRFSLPRVKK